MVSKHVATWPPYRSSTKHPRFSSCPERPEADGESKKNGATHRVICDHSPLDFFAADSRSTCGEPPSRRLRLHELPMCVFRYKSRAILSRSGTNHGLQPVGVLTNVGYISYAWTGELAVSHSSCIRVIRRCRPRTHIADGKTLPPYAPATSGNEPQLRLMSTADVKKQ